MMELLYVTEGDKKFKIKWGSPDFKKHRDATECHICKDEITCDLSLNQFAQHQKDQKDQKEANQRLEDYHIEEDDSVLEIEDEAWNKGPKVYDHNHWTGEYRGAAHSVCNQQLYTTKRIPILFHNLEGYDSHLIFQEIHKVPGIKVEVLAKTLERFIMFNVKFPEGAFSLDFKDSLNFLPSSLEKLVKNLKLKADSEVKKSGEEEMQILNKYFPTTIRDFKEKFPSMSLSALKLLLRKGVFPYSYLTSLNKLAETELPSQDKFYNELTSEDIKDSEYVHAQNVWREFGCETLKDYHDLYLLLDTTLLADVFETFRRGSYEVYDLDPTHFCTAPGLSWHACLKYTRVKLQIVTDPDMSIFIDEALIGGVSMARNPYLQANNHLLPDHFKESLQKTWMILVDCNNQYGWAMSQYLPTGGFSWVEDLSKFNEDFIKNLPDHQVTGYYLEVDLSYPNHLHKLHDQYPLAPEHITIKEEMLSTYQKDLAKDLGIKVKGSKLCLTLQKKVSYKLHYRNLKQYLSLGMKLERVHRVLEFKQSPWVRPYIELNTNLRRKATCKADEVHNFF